MLDGPWLHPYIRDLAWLIASPSLLAEDVPGLPLPPRAWLDQLAEDAGEWLAALDDQPRELQRMIAAVEESHPADVRRMGRRAELLAEYWLANHPDCVLRASRLSVFDGPRVLGELDLVFRSRDRAIDVHWEMAVKFYLRVDIGGHDLFIGPDPHDRLDLKLSHLRDHQLPLAGDPRALAALGLERRPCSEVLLKGWLFHPAAGDWRRPAGLPPEVAGDHARGWWLRHGQGGIPQQARSSRYVLVPRGEWLPRFHRPDDGLVQPLALRQLGNAIERHFARDPDPLLVCEVARDGDGWWREQARGFVVHPAWPELAP